MIEEFVNIAVAGVMRVELRCDTFDKVGIGAGRYGSPPLVGDRATGENHDHAPCVIIPNLVDIENECGKYGKG